MSALATFGQTIDKNGGTLLSALSLSIADASASMS